MFSFKIFYLRQSWLVANSVYTADTNKTRPDKGSNLLSRARRRRKIQTKILFISKYARYIDAMNLLLCIYIRNTVYEIEEGLPSMAHRCKTFLRFHCFHKNAF